MYNVCEELLAAPIYICNLAGCLPTHAFIVAVSTLLNGLGCLTPKSYPNNCRQPQGNIKLIVVLDVHVRRLNPTHHTMAIQLKLPG